MAIKVGQSAARLDPSDVQFHIYLSRDVHYDPREDLLWKHTALPVTADLAGMVGELKVEYR